MDAITRLEIELERLAAFNAGTNDQLARAVDHVFAWVGDSVDIAPALDWYLDFLSGRDEEWLKVVSTDRLSRLWKSVSHLPLRAKVLSTLLTLDLVNDPRYPENSVVRKLFIDSNGLGARAELVGDCRIIAQMLLQRAVAASESTTTEMAIRNVRNFSLRVLRLGIQAKFPDDSDLQTAIAESAILAGLRAGGTPQASLARCNGIIPGNYEFKSG